MKNNGMQQGIDYIGVCVVYFCHDGKGNVILAKRNANTRDEHGRWDTGGGGVEFSQTIEDTIKKEIEEEYYTQVLETEFLGFRDVHRIHDNKKTHWVALDFKVLVDPKKVANGEPHKFDEVRFFPFDQLPSPLHSQLPYFFEKYHQKVFKKI
jgi:8-oxo-dGTP diphosphatase